MFSTFSLFWRFHVHDQNGDNNKFHTRYSPYLFQVHIFSTRDSPVRGQVDLLKIDSVYGHFTPIGGGGKMVILGYF